MIDGSSKEGYNESVAKMLKPLEYYDQAQLLENMQIIAFEGEDMNEFVKSPNKEEIHYNLHMVKLDGMTIDQITTKGKEISSRKLTEGESPLPDNPQNPQETN